MECLLNAYYPDNRADDGGPYGEADSQPSKAKSPLFHGRFHVVTSDSASGAVFEYNAFTFERIRIFIFRLPFFPRFLNDAAESVLFWEESRTLSYPDSNGAEDP